jgi:SAM-dependent methyltransferase
MSKTVDRGKAEIVALCDYFAKNREAFHASGVKEAHVRQSLIDPLFEALGWNVANNPPVAPQYREVIPEDSLDVEGEQKAPDYTFRVGTLPKFYVEAKKCGVNISADPGPAYQLRRYGWSAKVAVSILTDFEELAVYDCTIRPRPADKAGHARIHYVRFDEYPDRWPELWAIFSREAVWSGAFDQYAASKRKRGTSEVDVEFLKEIEGWRDELARNIALRNPSLSGDELNRAVQLTIDRVVFLRMAEDRGLEPYDQLLSLCERATVYERFIRDLCRKADDKYNSGLFHFQKEDGVSEAPDQITPRLAVDDKVFKPILQSLYFAHGSPYHFGVMPVEILGTVYERFLGNVIRLTAGHQAKVEEKPEVRKAGGVHYTPAYIVDYIVRETVGRQIEGKSPAQLAGGKGKPPLRVLDMACGSGSFLLGAYRCLLDHCLKWYIDKGPEKYPEAVYAARAGDWRLTNAEKKRILTTHVFGVDIDPQAVEVSKLSLLLKVLEGESAETIGETLRLFHERALPNLADNIKCGNSLIGPDYFTGRLIPDTAELARVNAFDWKREFPAAMKAGGFDCVIGNPPYIRIQTMKEWAPLEVQAYKGLYGTAREGNYDIYIVFVERGLQLLNSRGQLGFICPNKFFATDYGKALRGLIAEHKALSEIVDFGASQVFENATTYTCLLFLSASPTDEVCYAKAPIPSSVGLAHLVHRRMPAERFSSPPWSFSTDHEQQIIDKLLSASKPLGALPCKIGRGSSTGDDNVFMLSRHGTALSTRQGDKVVIENDILRVPIYATDFNRYSFNPHSGEVVIFPYEVSAAGYQLMPDATLRCRFPKAYRYLTERKKELEARKQFRSWYSYSAPRNLDVHDSAQIVVPLLADMGLYCRLPQDANLYCLMASGGFSITVSDSCGLAASYVLGLLNSRLLFWRLHSISNIFRAGWITCTKQYVETLPIRTIDFNNREEKSAHDRMVQLVDSMLALHKQLASAKSEAQRGVIQRQVDATDAEIDRLVYALYGLTKDEIAIVEGASA